MSVEEFDRRRREGETLGLLDVRERYEFEYAHIAGSTLIPLRQLPDRAGELDPSGAYVVHCHYAERSREACRYLRLAGFRNVTVLEGGIDAWAARIDPSLPRY